MTTGARFRPVRHVRAYERIVEQVEQAIADGDLKPGERLPSERDLVTQFSVSRSTVREALRVLESQGVIRSHPGDPRGAEVLRVSGLALAKQMHLLARFDELSLADLVSFRMILDGSANQLAARLHTPEQLSDMQFALEGMRDAVDLGYVAFSEADVAFHEAVSRASRNSLIQVCNHVTRDTVLSLISDKIAGSRNRKALMRESVKHHEEVLAAVAVGDGRRAASVARRNLFDYYCGYVAEADRDQLLALVYDAGDAEVTGPCSKSV